MESKPISGQLCRTSESLCITPCYRENGPHMLSLPEGTLIQTEVVAGKSVTVFYQRGPGDTVTKIWRFDAQFFTSMCRAATERNCHILATSNAVYFLDNSDGELRKFASKDSGLPTADE